MPIIVPVDNPESDVVDFTGKFFRKSDDELLLGILGICIFDGENVTDNGLIVEVRATVGVGATYGKVTFGLVVVGIGVELPNTGAIDAVDALGAIGAVGCVLIYL